MAEWMELGPGGLLSTMSPSSRALAGIFGPLRRPVEIGWSSSPPA